MGSLLPASHNLHIYIYIYTRASACVHRCTTLPHMKGKRRLEV